jgi:hypothetical protein
MQMLNLESEEEALPQSFLGAIPIEEHGKTEASATRKYHEGAHH